MPKIMGNSLAEHRERTRNALFEALSALMNHRSFDKITLSDVAAHAGVGRTAVYNHFANKEDLLLAFMEHETARYAEELSRALAGMEDPIDRLRVYVRQQALIKRHYHFPSTGPLANSVSRGTASRLRSHAGLMTQMLAQILTDAMNCGAIPRQDPSQMIPLVHACVTIDFLRYSIALSSSITFASLKNAACIIMFILFPKPIFSARSVAFIV